LPWYRKGKICWTSSKVRPLAEAKEDNFEATNCSETDFGKTSDTESNQQEIK